MKPIVIRIGQVLWWLAAAIWAAGVLGAVNALINRASDWPAYLVIACLYAVGPLILCFVLTGSLKRPPRAP